MFLFIFYYKINEEQKIVIVSRITKKLARSDKMILI